MSRPNYSQKKQASMVKGSQDGEADASVCLVIQERFGGGPYRRTDQRPGLLSRTDAVDGRVLICWIWGQMPNTLTICMYAILGSFMRLSN